MALLTRLVPAFLIALSGVALAAAEKATDMPSRPLGGGAAGAGTIRPDATMLQFPDVGRDTISAARQAFLAETGQSETDFTAAYAALGAQRALRILGIFARLCIRDAKPGYLRLVPRVWGQLQQNLAHPALAALARVCEAELPPPSDARLKRMEDQCPHLTR